VAMDTDIRSTPSTRRTVVSAAVPPAAAIFVFGVIYGSLARPLMGAALTILSSLLIFSGSVQFTLAAFVAAGAGAGALVAGAMTLNMRNLVLGAVLRPRLSVGPLRRAGLGWFLTDEAAGLALTSEDDAATVLLTSGAMFYISWVLGTVVGVLGASLEGLQAIAGSVFPVLFIGLAALAATTRSIVIRAFAAASLTAVVGLSFPDITGVAAVVFAILVALPGRTT
jgi:predicted branched-subunit amino acid permease